MKKLHLTILFACTMAVAVAQKETYNWHFGNNSFITFNSGAPVFVPGCGIGNIQPTEGCATMSDANGNVLFYTDGIAAWNVNNDTMPNGTSLGANFSTTQGAVIVPWPAHANQYFIFSLTEIFDPTHALYYSVVDMSLAGGLGDVTVKNALVADSMTEKMIAIRHGNGNDYWLVTHKRLSDEFQCYLIDSSGVSANPVVSHAGVTITSNQAVGSLKANRSGSKIAAAYWDLSGLFEVYNFDNMLGIVDANVLLSQPASRAFSVEFSPNERYLYGSCYSDNTIYQYDMLAPLAPGVLIGTAQNYTGDILLAPDGKLYVAITNADSLAVINQPNLPGTACNFVAGGFYLDGNQCMIGLPNFIHDMITITSVPTVEDNNNIVNVYPNPFSDVVTIQFKNTTNAQTTFAIKNMLGQTVFEEKENTINTNTKTIDVGFLSKGIYFVDVNVGDVRMVTKVVKQ